MVSIRLFSRTLSIILFFVSIRLFSRTLLMYSSELDFFRPFPIIISYVNRFFRYDNLISFFNNMCAPCYYVYQRVFLKKAMNEYYKSSNLVFVVL